MEVTSVQDEARDEANASTKSARLQVASSLSVDTFTPDEAPISAEVTLASPARAQPSKRDDEPKKGLEGKKAHKKPIRKKWRPRWWRLFRVRRQQHMKSVVDTVFEKYSRHPEKKYLDVKELNYVMLYLYDDLNQKLPFHMPPPTPEDVDLLCAKHQVEGKDTELIDKFKLKKIFEEALGLRAADSLLFTTIKTGLKEVVLKPFLFTFAKNMATESGLLAHARYRVALPATVLLTAFNQVGKYLYALKTALSMS